MSRWTQAQFDEYMDKINAGGIFPVENLKSLRIYQPESFEIYQPESSLQKKINQWAKDWGHPILSLRQSKQARGFITPGWPDITLILHNRVLFLELKAKKGRMTQEQKNMRLMMMAHKAEFYEVRSYKQFLEIIEK